ncbi:DinB family protein [Desertihabitans aurantiacus]|uniref:DinB family protein n=1 Tax=Desertihabitans aurantiacus TaxID=2282477 RepID=UPI000DF8191B|nr:DinB family protein [Desertihabitans aurantiacus]
MAEIVGRDLSDSRFERVDLSRTRFRSIDLAGTRFHDVNLYRAVLRAAWLVEVDITGEIRDLTINGVDVGPLVEAELDRRDPERVLMRPTDPDGFRRAWDVVEHRWEETVARARELAPEQLHVSVDGEWSFTETLRHLLFATDAWVGRAVLGDPAPWHPLDLPWDELSDGPGVPRDRAARPSLEEVLALRRERMATVRRVLDELTPARLEESTTPVDGPGWPPAEAYPVRECLLTVLNEEWEHRRYAERDLAVLERGGPAPADG